MVLNNKIEDLYKEIKILQDAVAVLQEMDEEKEMKDVQVFK